MTRGDEPWEKPLRDRLAAPLRAFPRAARTAAAAEHPEPEILLAHAANELPPEEALGVTQHLAVCDDGGCSAILRDAVAGAAIARDALYLTRREELTDPSLGAPHRQSARSFECADATWEAFEAMARDEGCSTDWLVNEAMKVYAQQRPIAPRDVTVTDAPPPDPRRERNTPTLPRAYLPRTPPSSRRIPAQPPLPGPASARLLMVVVEGIRYEVNKERFVVGRRAPASDLTIDDPIVSRQHALIEHAGGRYFLVDMGSTNGVEYRGERIDRRQIAHGDRFLIGDHELEFLFG
jgi:hypothetical protein